jgi:hypothetical protein
MRIAIKFEYSLVQTLTFHAALETDLLAQFIRLHKHFRQAAASKMSSNAVTKQPEQQVSQSMGQGMVETKEQSASASANVSPDSAKRCGLVDN